MIDKKKKKKEKIYIAGPMTGYEDFNFPAFAKAKIELEKKGYIVISPHEISIELSERLHVALNSLPKTMYMRYDLIQLLGCDCIYMLKNWEKSEGANAEFVVAQAIGLEILYEEKD